MTVLEAAPVRRADMAVDDHVCDRDFARTRGSRGYFTAPHRELAAISSQYVDTLTSVQGGFIDARGVDVLPLTCRG